MGKPEIDGMVGRRLEPRTRVTAFAQLITTDDILHAEVVGLSPRGAGLRLDVLPAVGSEVVLSLRSCDVPAKVLWAHGRSCGIAFTSPAPADIMSILNRPIRSERYVRDFTRSLSRKP
jgi:hypothetical protein